MTVKPGSISGANNKQTYLGMHWSHESSPYIPALIVNVSGADDLPELLRFYSRKRIFRNHTPIHRKPEDPLAIHPTS